jgi:hypothetical protein
VSWFDDVQVVNMYYTNLAIVPSNVTGFVGGVWTGSVNVQPAATNVYLTVSDLAEHIGASDLFQVLEPEIVRFLKVQRLANGAFQAWIQGRVGETYTLLSSTNLVHWAPRLSFPCTNTPTIVIDNGGQDDQQRFYRLTR